MYTLANYVFSCADQYTLVRMLAILGKGFITACFSGAYVYATELFPTEVRNMGLGMTSMAARVGAMMAPFVGAPLVGSFHSCFISGKIICLKATETSN